MFLRFYMKNELDGMTGDPSTSFGFSSFFPSFVQQPITKFGNYVYIFAIKFNIVPKFEQYKYASVFDSSKAFERKQYSKHRALKGLENDVEQFRVENQNRSEDLQVIIDNNQKSKSGSTIRSPSTNQKPN